MYHLRTITLKNGTKEKKVLAIDFDDPNMSIVGEFLMADARLLGGKVLQEIDEVLTGYVPELTSNGNRSALTIGPNITIMSDLFSDMDGIDAYPTYEIETKQLRDLIIMWFDELNKFEQNN